MKSSSFGQLVGRFVETATDLARPSGFAGVAMVVRTACSLVVVKIVSVVGGPQVLALVGQVQSIMQLGSSLSSVGLVPGVPKLVAQSSEPEEVGERLAELTPPLVLGVLLWIAAWSVAVLAFPQMLDFGQEGWAAMRLLTWAPLILGPILGFANLVVAAANGLLQVRKCTIFGVSVAAWNLATISVAAATSSNLGIVVAVMIGPLGSLAFSRVILGVAWRHWTRAIRLGNVWSGAGSPRKLIAMGMFSVLIAPMVPILIRSLLSARFGGMEAGLWEGVNRVSLLSVSLIASLTSMYLLPKISQVAKQSIREAWGLAVRAGLLLSGLVAAGFLVLLLPGDIFIHLIFSSEFVGLRHYVSVQAIGDVVRPLAMVINILFWAVEEAKSFILLESIFLIASTLALSAGALTQGVSGVVWAYAVSQMGYLLASVWIVRRQILRPRS